MPSYPVRIALLCVLVPALLSPLTAAPCRDSTTRNRVVAIADVHGALEQFLAILRRTGIVDEENRWSGGCTTLIQVGDLIDRGPHDRAVLDLIIELQKSAPRYGGQVFVAIGNHEVMNVMGDLRYVTREAFAFFADSKTEKRREAAFKQYRAYLNKRARFLREPKLNVEVDKARWLEEHPPGFFEHRRAFSESGKYGKWIRKGSAIVRHQDILYLHGGLSPELTNPVQDLNKRIRFELKVFDDYVQYLTRHDVVLPFFRMHEMVAAAQKEFDHWESMSPLANGPSQANHLGILEEFLQMGSWIITHPQEPLWFRGYAKWSEEEGRDRVATVLETHGVDRIVVGHTLMPDAGIRMRFDGRIILIDTGLYTDFFPGGRPSALEIHNGEFHAVYLNDKQKLLPGS